MPTKRAILSKLTRDELRVNVDYYELDVHDRRVRSQLVDALAGSRRAPLDAMLWELPRRRLKELCQAFDLDDSGRRKSDLVERLISRTRASKTTRGPRAAPTAASKNPRAARAAAAVRTAEPSNARKARAARSEPPAETADPPAETLGIDQLERYLWSAANILRRSIDSSDYKTYIFGLLFLKRLSDRFEEEAERLVAEGVSEAVAWTDPDEHQFFVPDRARWSAILRTATNIGEALNKACAALEEQNPALEGVLAGIDYNDEHRLGDPRSRDTVLARLVQHFSQVSLRNDRMAEPDLLGRAYEYLIKQFADDAGKKGGEFYTPRMVVKLIVELLAPTERMRICDPTAGSGGMLIECAHHIERQGGNSRNLTLHGQRHSSSAGTCVRSPGAGHERVADRAAEIGRMREVRTTDARARLAELLRAVEGGETVAITRHGRKVAHLTPTPDQERAARREAVQRFRAHRRRWRRVEATTEEICAWRRQGRR